MNSFRRQGEELTAYAALVSPNVAHESGQRLAPWRDGGKTIISRLSTTRPDQPVEVIVALRDFSGWNVPLKPPTAFRSATTNAQLAADRQAAIDGDLHESIRDDHAGPVEQANTVIQQLVTARQALDIDDGPCHPESDAAKE